MTTERNMVSNKRNTLLVIVALVMLQIGITSDLLAFNKMYRFVDKNGKTVVRSTLPPEVSQNGYEIINELGIVIETIQPRKTDEQLRQEKLDAERLAEVRRQQREQEKLDSILINSYTDISDIERAKDNEIESKERDIMLLKQNVRRYTRLLEAAQTRAARDERLGKELSPTLLKEIEQLKRRIAREQVEVTEIEGDKADVNDRYDSSIIRFSELKAAERLRRFNDNQDIDKEKLMIFECTGRTPCDQAWSASLRFASEYSTTELAWANESTIMMLKPREDNDTSLVLTRVNNSSVEAASIVLEIRCNKSQACESHCLSDAVNQIKDNFISYVQAGPTRSP